MALTPIDETHAFQIQAGIIGRRAGHDFEDKLAANINDIKYPLKFVATLKNHLFRGNPAELILGYICSSLKIDFLEEATALSTGALATSEEGKKWLYVNGVTVRKCKSDIILTLRSAKGHAKTVGVSTKQCNNNTPTNAQLYFTTSKGFSNLLSKKWYLCLTRGRKCTTAILRRLWISTLRFSTRNFE